MKTIFIAGLINLETTLRVEAFPLDYFPVTYPFNGVRSSISGVGYNVARAMGTLGDDVRLAAMIGQDPVGDLVRDAMLRQGLDTGLIERGLADTPQSVIIYDPAGRRQIHVDLKNIQEERYPDGNLRGVLPACSLAVLCNINFARELIAPVRDAGLPIATDVHALADPADAYNRDFMRAADILFVSNEHFRGREKEMLAELMNRYPCRLIACGQGADGALLAIRSGAQWRWHHQGAMATRPVVNTVGAGDALFSSFNHYLAKGQAAEDALRLATVFASWKIGATGAAEGFLSEQDVLQLDPARMRSAPLEQAGE